MSLRPVAILLAAVMLALPLSACGIPGGIAYAIKEGNKEMQKDGTSPTTTAPDSAEETSTPAARDVDPPPQPASAPRDAMTVETLK
jgi:hypothetical protein